jgi:hypothetical protein
VTREQLLQLHRDYTEKMHVILRKKNADYTGTAGPFANFERVEALGIATTEQGFLTRILDKICRLTTFVQKGVLQVSDESVEDTCLDGANYLLLLAAYIRDKKEQSCKPTSEPTQDAILTIHGLKLPTSS